MKGKRNYLTNLFYNTFAIIFIRELNPIEIDRDWNASVLIELN